MSVEVKQVTREELLRRKYELAALLAILRLRSAEDVEAELAEIKFLLGDEQ